MVFWDVFLLDQRVADYDSSSEYLPGASTSMAEGTDFPSVCTCFMAGQGYTQTVA